jgi:hypothetical protein
VYTRLYHPRRHRKIACVVGSYGYRLHTVGEQVLPEEASVTIEQQHFAIPEVQQEVVLIGNDDPPDAPTARQAPRFLAIAPEDFHQWLRLPVEAAIHTDHKRTVTS